MSKTPKKSKTAAQREPTPAELLQLAEGDSPEQRIAAAMRTGNHELVAAVRRELGR